MDMTWLLITLLPAVPPAVLSIVNGTEQRTLVPLVVLLVASFVLSTITQDAFDDLPHIGETWALVAFATLLAFSTAMWFASGGF